MRARKKKWAETELLENEYIFQNAIDCKDIWEQIFGNVQPIALEIGCGMGSFIVESAKNKPNMNFIGLEREKMVIVTGARKIREWNESIDDTANAIENVRFVLGEAAELEEFIAPGEISRIYINFCDPWVRRKKWAKRRLTHRSFLDMYKKLLCAGGELHLKTDSAELFEFSANELLECGWRLNNLTLDLHNSRWAADNVITEYEAKFAAKGMPIYRLEAGVGKEAADIG